uniref:uncharacterized protein LOC125417154 isoform X2 n=1 Tax=Myodes glareolus TaxID=447135 RepID=UPI00202118C2|nr:uncharacterized protein LOC125417154 isoform X2 [Myodes glareolus]
MLSVRPDRLQLAFGFGRATHTAKSGLPLLHLPGCFTPGIDLFLLPRQVTLAAWAKINSQSALQTTPNTCSSSWDFIIGTNSPGSRTPDN